MLINVWTVVEIPRDNKEKINTLSVCSSVLAGYQKKFKEIRKGNI